jgi:signal transduction histidine kinase
LPKLKTQILPATLVAVVAFGITLILAQLSFFAFIELKGLDLLFTLRGPLPPPEDIVIVAIDEPSMAEIGQQWPWPRSLHAQLIQKLNQAGARVIGFDILFAEPSTPTEDQAFAHALQDAKNVVLVSALSVINDPLFRHITRVDPAPVFQDIAIIGNPLISLDVDGIARRTRLMELDMPSFALQVFRRFIGNPAAVMEALGQRRFSRQAIFENGLINYWGPARTLKTVSYYQALDDARMLPPGLFNDKIVLIGWSLEGMPEPQHKTGDLFLTPFSWLGEGAVSGVEVQGTIISNILEGRFIRELDSSQRWFLLLALALTVSACFAWVNPVAAPFAVILWSALLLALAEWIFAKTHLWLPLFSGILIVILTYSGHLLVGTLNAERERRLLLEKVNRELESKVVERTQELVNAHQELGERHLLLETAYRDLATTQEQLIHSEKMASLGMLVAGIAHELNNPISYLHSNLEFIEDYLERLAGMIPTPAVHPGQSDDTPSRRVSPLDATLKTLRDLIASCQEGSERVKKIVLDLRTFSRTDEAGLALADLHEGLESTLNLLNPQYRNRITLHRDYGSLPLIECYPSQINQVLMNLLQNAAQAIPRQGDVWIHTEATENWVKIVIRDNGMGIANELLNRIFDPFFTTKDIGLGIGLGLSISYGIIAKHGGKIRVNSKIQEGTEFTIELPVYAPKVIHS